ncbi:MAG: ABC transporter substrate-binding protein, partial [Ktedonobacterales bacterium]
MAEVFGRNGRAAGSASVASVRHYARLSVRLSFALVGLVALLLAACGTNNGSGPPLAKSQTFSWPYFGTDQMQHNAVMDPAMLTAAEDTGTINMLFSGLVTLKPNLSVEPDAATWTVDPTGTIYDFHLKHNLHFSDGTPITASDYAYSIDRALDPNLCGVQDAKSYGPGGAGSCTPNSPNIGDNYLSMILGATDRVSGTIGTIIGQGSDQTHGLDVVDPYTLRIRLVHPVQYFLEALTYPTSFPVERSLVQKYPGGLFFDHLYEGGCSGPFNV